jgi:SAM-dependent methyltransferase
MNAPGLAAQRSTTNAEMVAAHYEEIETRHSFRRYRGLPMICVPGLHELAGELARRYLRPGARVLDVGCGRGAFALRMADAGFEVDAWDLLDTCACKDRVNFRQVAAEEAPAGPEYSGIFMLELLEHTESPVGLIRRYAQRLEVGGHLVVSTPNLNSSISRSWFFLSGRHWYFEDRNLRTDGHVSPVHDFQLEHALDEAGLELVGRFRTPETRSLGIGAHWLANRLLQAYEFLKGGRAESGPVAITVARRRA